MPYNFYGINAFAGAKNSCPVVGNNFAPGGDTGVDRDTQWSIGSPGSINVQDGYQGICTGATLAWIASFCNGRVDAIDTNMFSSYANNTLQFQGTYIQELYEFESPSGAEIFKALDAGIHTVAAGLLQVHGLPRILPQYGHWAGYVSIFGHAIGIGLVPFNRHYIMDMNCGLFEYDKRDLFYRAVVHFVEHRRVKKNLPPGSEIKVILFSRHNMPGDAIFREANED